MLDGIKTLVMMLAIVIAPVVAFDGFLNNWLWWSVIAKHTLIDEAFASFLRIIF